MLRHYLVISYLLITKHARCVVPRIILIMKVAILRLIVVGHLLSYNHIICSFTGGFYAIRWNSRQTGSVFDKIQGMNFIDCIDECLRRKRCGSVNYTRRNLLCELNGIDTFGNILRNHVEGYIHSDKTSWDAVSN